MTSPGGVRPEYEALARDFRRLAELFDLPVGERLEQDLLLVAATFESVDRHVDATSDEAVRARLCDTILRTLREASAAGAESGE
ncbi:MAG TPA: hypothetical protein VHS09_10705, partial [Polyangiaceae bacterium]|nr:hypothetical protein [Polyangiaceae bacterium]